MSDKNFFQFLKSEKQTTSTLDNMILAQAKTNLLKEQIYALLNVVAIHAAAGTATLAICPQFGWNPLGGNPHITHIFMAYGTWACGMFCGALFMGFGSFIKIFLLKKRTLLTFERKEVFNSLIISGIFLFSLMSVGKLIVAESFYFSIIFLSFWFLGSLLMELLSFYTSKKLIVKS